MREDRNQQSTWSTYQESSLNPQATFFDTRGAPYVLKFPSDLER